MPQDANPKTTGAVRKARAAPPALPALAERLTDLAAELLATSASHRALERRLELLVAEGAHHERVRSLSSEAALLKRRMAMLTEASAQARGAYEEEVRRRRQRAAGPR